MNRNARRPICTAAYIKIYNLILDGVELVLRMVVNLSVSMSLNGRKDTFGDLTLSTQVRKL